MIILDICHLSLGWGIWLVIILTLIRWLNCRVLYHIISLYHCFTLYHSAQHLEISDIQLVQINKGDIPCWGNHITSGQMRPTDWNLTHGVLSEMRIYSDNFRENLIGKSIFFTSLLRLICCECLLQRRACSFCNSLTTKLPSSLISSASLIGTPGRKELFHPKREGKY